MLPLDATTMFFAGLILLIPHRIGMSRVNYVIKRYNLPISRAGLLLYKYHNNIELSLLFGTLPGNIIVWIVGFNSWKKKIISYCMIVFLILMFLSSIFMFIVYVIGSDYGHLNLFYFTLILITLFDGFTNAFAFGLNPGGSSMLSAGIPLSGLLVTLLHYTYKFFYDIYHWDDFDYYVLRLQLIFNTIFIFITFCLWIYDATEKGDSQANFVSPLYLFGLDKNGKPFAGGNSNESHALDWVPIGMLAISLGTVYAFYPSIAPYSIIDFQYASVVELWILVISALLPLSFAIMDAFSEDWGGGPSGKIELHWDNTTTLQSCPATGGDNSNTTKGFKIPAISGNWVGQTGSDNHPWHLVWLCAIFYILCIQIFMSLLHYPDCLLSCFFNNNPYLIVFISILFNTLREVMQACGFAGAGKQCKNPPTYGSSDLESLTCSTTTFTSGTHGPKCNILRDQKKWKSDKPDDGYKINGCIAATNKLITLFVMMFCVFTGDGYLQHYRRCCRDNWPTTGYNKYQSFFYWLRYGFKGGIKSITLS